MKRQRSSSSGRTRFAGGPTYSARLGSTPPIQLGPSRSRPAILSSGGTTAISRWIPSIEATVNGPSLEVVAKARSIARTVPTISRAR